MFDPHKLNASQAEVIHSLPRSSQNTSPYLIATLRGFNATGTEAEDDPAPIPTAAPTNNDDGPTQGPAMIILYVIVSLVSALFCVVIISGVGFIFSDNRP